ncbi:CACTA en-spm transposon protein [Cucumis melo var. makuwa]|uniref:CACTA en-spm transposon protein n=1 Tax=Cucumis melo var. makuwa TaxID=1194695 RepID=A0A5D3BQF8_CUCMM|nr:CACTA en-spm transposon protein [Cucumis melo var. makuwa]
METDAMILEFEDDLDNIAKVSSSVGDNMERHVAINGRISMTISPGAEKPISPHAVRFNQTIGVCVRKTFPVRCLKWANVGRDTLRLSRATSRFIEHQMLTTFKEFWVDCHIHFKKYSDSEEARANPPNALVGHHED